MAPADRPWTSVRRSVVLRLLGALVLAGVLISGAVVLAHRHANQSFGEQQLDNAVAHFRARMVSLDRNWLTQADLFRGQLEFNRVLDDPSAAARQARLTAYAASLGGEGLFTQIVIVDKDGRELHAYRTGTQQRLELPPSGPLPATWVYGKQDRVLYRAVAQSVRFAGISARLLLYSPVDNAVLDANVYPKTRVGLTWQNETLARTMPLEAAGSGALVLTRTVPWEQGAAPGLIVERLVEPAFSFVQLLLTVALAVALIALLGWLVLGRWLGQLAARLSSLNAAALAFSESTALAPPLQRSIEEVIRAGHDEVGHLAHSIGNMMERVARAGQAQELSTAELTAALEQLRRSEEALTRLNEELEQRVERRTSDMAAARAEAERANRAKSEFLSRMSHELRTPLNAILGFGQLLARDPLQREQADNVREILRAGQHLLELINEVLDLARIESGKFTVSLEPVALAPLVEECLGLFRPQALARGIRIGDAVRDCSEHVMADRTRLKQVLLNLMSNAVKYNREGGSMGVDCVRDGEQLQIRISDTGAGLSEQQQARLFVPFERLDADVTGIEGAGIGLALSKRLVEHMKGEIGLQSTPGVGSTFWVRLPLAQAPAAAAGQATTAAESAYTTPARSRQRDVLCIEDNPANLRLVERILARRPDIHFLSASAPGLGLEMARSHRPALILLDINLPDLDGYAVMRCLRENVATRDIPVVAISANAMPQDLARGAAAGFADYLTKPLEVERLMQVVDLVTGPREGSGAAL